MDNEPIVGAVDDQNHLTVQDTNVARYQKRPLIQNSGLSELHNPSPRDKIIADIVFVHGLAGSPFEAWLYGKSSRRVDSGGTAKTSKWNMLQGKRKRNSEKTDSRDEPAVRSP